MTDDDPMLRSGWPADGAGPVSGLGLRRIRALVAVADSGSVSGAATRLRITQPALSRSVTLAERALGRPLFRRGARGADPTPEWHLLAPRLHRVLGHLEDCATELAATGVDAYALSHRVAARHLAAFMVVAETGAAPAAARRLGLSVSLVYRYLRMLEAAAGAPLLRRTETGAEPTPAGALVLRRARLLAAELRHADAALAEHLGEIRGRLAIGSMPLSRTYLLPQAIARLKRDNPHVTVALVDGPYATLLDMLRHGDLDMLVGALRAPAPAADVTEHALFEEPLAIVARCGHPLLGRARPEIAELARWPWAVPREGTPMHAHFRALLARGGQAFPADVVVTSSLGAIRTLLMDSDRLAIVSRHQVQFEIATGVLGMLPLDLPGTERPIGYTLSALVAPPPALLRLIGHLRTVSAAAAPEGGRVPA